jgi:hypothetical protein
MYDQQSANACLLNRLTISLKSTFIIASLGYLNKEYDPKRVFNSVRCCVTFNY